MSIYCKPHHFFSNMETTKIFNTNVGTLEELDRGASIENPEFKIHP